MSDSSPRSTDAVHVAVALIVDRQDRLLLTFNEKWRGYAPPMTKLRRSPGGVENPIAAARRAAEAVLGVSMVTAGENMKDHEELTSGRDHRRKHYEYEIVPMKPKDGRVEDLKIAGVHAWLNVKQIVMDEVTPMTDSARIIVARLVKHNALPFRCSRTSVLIVRQSQGGRMRYLLSKVRNWGYMFPLKRANPDESAIDTARRVVIEELALKAPRQIHYARSAVDTLIVGPVKSLKKGGWYLHHLFDAELTAPLAADVDMVWATAREIQAGMIGADGGKHSGAVISPTARLILEQVG